MPEFTDHTATALTGDPDLDALVTGIGETSSELDDLEAELTVKADLTALIEVPERPGYAIRCRTDFTGRDCDLIRQKCRDKKFSDGIDGVKYASLLLASMTVAIVRHGVDLELDGEGPITFVSKPLQERMGTPNSADLTVRAFYGREGHVDSAGQRLMTEAGYGAEVYTVDPTR